MAHPLSFIVLALLLAATWRVEAAEITESAETDGVIIAIRGDLEAGDDRKFDQVAQRYSKGSVYLESRGGDLLTGISIGESIRLKGFVTILPPNSTCASSCALAWLGGARRFLSPTSRLGFHAAYSMDGTSVRETGVGNAVIGAYLTRIGLPVSAVIYITKASPHSITWLTPTDAQKVGIEFSFSENTTPASPLNKPQIASQPASSPRARPTQKEEVMTSPGGPQKSKIMERYYVAVDDKIVELRNLPGRCVHYEDSVSFVGKVMDTNLAKDGVKIESFILEKLDKTRETINVLYGLDHDFSMADLGWIASGLQTMLRKGHEVRGVAKLCREGQRVMFLEELKRQGPTPAPLSSQTSSQPEKTPQSQESETAAATAVNSKCPMTVNPHYKAACGRVIEVLKLSSDCGNALGIEDLKGKVVQTDLGDDGITFRGFAIEYTGDGEREFINVEMPSDISISEIRVIFQGLRSILRQGRVVTGEMRRCGAAGRVLVLESVKAISTSTKATREADP